MKSAVGYLLHHYFRESEGQAVVFYDEALTDTRTPMGGTGKGLIANGLRQVRNVTKIDGKHMEPTNRFRWELVGPDTQIVWIDDTKPDFDFAMLHSNLTDGWTVERKHLSQFSIPPKDSPKTMLCSNSIIKGEGTTNRRRQFVVELSPHYSRRIVRGDEKPIEDEHGGLFFSDESWDAAEWGRFHATMMDCARLYLSDGLVPHEGINVEMNRFRQTVGEDFAGWITDKAPAKGVWHETEPFYRDFIRATYGDDPRAPGQRKVTEWIKMYAALAGGSYQNKRTNGISYFSL